MSADYSFTDAEISKQLSSGDPRERMIGALLVGKLRKHTLLRKVIALLEDPNREVRSRAAYALDLLGNPDSIPALLGALYDRSFDVRSNAGWALVHLAQRLSLHLVVPDVIDVLRDKHDADARQMAYLVLYHIGGPEAREAMDSYG